MRPYRNSEDPMAVPELLEYVQRMRDDEHEVMIENYEMYNEDGNIADFETLLGLIEEALRVHRIHLEESGKSGDFDDKTLKFAIDAGIKSCCSAHHDVELRDVTVRGGDERETQCLSHDLRVLIDPEFDAHRNPSRGAPSSQPQAGRHAAEPSHRRADTRPQDTRDRRRGPPQSNSNRHAGPSRQSGQASRGYGGGQAPSRRYVEESSSDGDW